MDFEIVLIGSDINAYYMARNFHEAYNRKANIIAKGPLFMTSISNIVDITYDSDILNKTTFVEKMKQYRLKFKDKKVVLVGCNDDYVRLIVEHKEELKDYYLTNYVDKNLLDNLLIKENFYENYHNILDLPKTYIFDIKGEIDFSKLEDFMYPVVVKPSNTVEYHTLSFEGAYKVFKATDKEDLKRIVNLLKTAGYKSNLIIQEFIPGDDTRLFDVVMYVDSKKNVSLMSFAQIGLQERSPLGVGNCTVVVNGFNEFNNTNIIKDKLIDFIKSIGYVGFLEFDLKYDERDKKFKVFEINPRQARSSYYVTACGYNLVKYLIDDLVFDKRYDFKFIDEQVALSFVPKSVVKKYVTSKPLRDKLLELYKKGKVVDSLNYKKDMPLKRFIWLQIRYLKYNYKYKKYKW